MIKKPDLNIYELEQTEKLVSKILEIEDSMKEIKNDMKKYKKYFYIFSFVLLLANMFLLVPVFIFQKYVPFAFAVGVVLFLLLIVAFKHFKENIIIEIKED